MHYCGSPDCNCSLFECTMYVHSLCYISVINQNVSCIVAISVVMRQRNGV